MEAVISSDSEAMRLLAPDALDAFSGALGFLVEAGATTTHT